MTPPSLSPTTDHPSVAVVPAVPVTASQTTGSPVDQGEDFVDRRQAPKQSSAPRERRQFGSSHRELSADGRELALAVDRYKVDHHRRYLTCDELLGVIASLGYSR